MALIGNRLDREEIKRIERTARDETTRHGTDFVTTRKDVLALTAEIWRLRTKMRSIGALTEDEGIW